MTWQNTHTQTHVKNYKDKMIMKFK